MADVLPNVRGDRGQVIEATPVALFGSDGGPAHVISLSANEAALRGGKAFLSSTATVEVPGGESLFAILSNPVGSGVDMVLVNRLFSNDRAANDANIEYQAYVNPTAVLPVNRPVANVVIGGGPSVITLRTAIDTPSNITMGGILASGEILPNGSPYSRPLHVIVRPGLSLGFSIDGQGGAALQSAANVSMTFEWYEVASNVE